jgi:crossover junction endodeoxyribonuclease RuvC
VIVLGIDPGTAITGYGVVAGERQGDARLLECGVIRTPASESLPSRLRGIHEAVTELIARHHPHVVALEDVFYAKNVRTTVVLGHARGVAMLAAEQAGIAVHEYAPAAVKKSVCGNGNATKVQVQFMVTRLLRLTRAPEPADAADGVAAALAHLMGAHLERLAASPANERRPRP